MENKICNRDSFVRFAFAHCCTRVGMSFLVTLVGAKLFHLAL